MNERKKMGRSKSLFIIVVVAFCAVAAHSSSPAGIPEKIQSLEHKAQGRRRGMTKGRRRSKMPNLQGIPLSWKENGPPQHRSLRSSSLTAKKERPTGRLATVFTTETLQMAVSEWCSNASSAIEKYGNISVWDTSEVNNMGGLFMPTDWEGHCSTAKTFNEDVSAWDGTFMFTSCPRFLK